ncbi:MAG: F0F1 ATP synthase subunit C [Candidatus Riflebacteria bacterium]|nr:F0F1 ATP synthase subunit C [Candidatus Riflebacteria bacterium]
MTSLTLIAVISIVTAAVTIIIGCITPAIAECYAIVTALNSLAQQPDEASNITRTLFVGLAMIESMAIYCLVVAMAIIFANPFWNYFVAAAAAAH